MFTVDRIAEHNRTQEADLADDLGHAAAVLERRGISADEVIASLEKFSVAAHEAWAKSLVGGPPS